MHEDPGERRSQTECGSQWLWPDLEPCRLQVKAALLERERAAGWLQTAWKLTLQIIRAKDEKRNELPRRNGCRNDLWTAVAYDDGVLKLSHGESIMPGGTKMVRTEKMSSERRRTAGDAAVDGLLAGAAGGIAMAGVLMVSALLTGEGPVRMLVRFAPAGSASPLTGAMVHLAVSAVYGLLLGVIYRLIGRGRLAGGLAGVVVGLVYGLALNVVAQGLAATAAGAALREIPALHFAVSHLVYGAVTGWLIARS